MPHGETMKIVCIGAGPAGLYFSILAKLSNRNHDITVVERNSAGMTYGWGVVFWEDLLDDLYRSDPESARASFDFQLAFGAEDPDKRGGIYGPLVPVPDDAPLLDRLLGLTGRDPAWSHPA